MSEIPAVPVIPIAPPASLKAQRQVHFPQPDGSSVPYSSRTQPALRRR